MANNKIIDAARALSASRDADVFVFNAAINRDSALELITTIKTARSKKPERKSAILFLTTRGGDPDAAFRIARGLKKSYEKVTVYVLGLCKSAGTLIVLGATEIVMSDFGELGPLDIQLTKQDDMIRRDSGLNFLGALELIQKETFEAFESYFIDIINNSGGAISTHTAGDLANSLAVGLYGKLMEQIDPIQVAEVKRSMSVAIQYGKLLCNSVELAETLASQYPSHSYTIDLEQAKELFEKANITVRSPVPDEVQLCEMLHRVMITQTQDPIIIFVEEPTGSLDSSPEDTHNGNNTSHEPTATESNGSTDRSSVSQADGTNHSADEGRSNPAGSGEARRRDEKANRS